MGIASIHLICGSTGAGKTTYAIKLAAELGAARFSIDEWMSTLFWMDSPQPIDPTWTMERLDRCSQMIWRTALEVALRGVPLVLEVGLTSRAERERWAAKGEAEGAAIHLHFLDVPEEERWKRVEVRNRTIGGGRQLTFAVTKEMFDFVEEMWEPPCADETRAYGSVTIVRQSR